MFKFTKDATEYTRTIGSLTPDKYSYDIQKNDIVDLRQKIHGIEMSTGRVIKKMKHSAAVQKELEYYEENYALSDGADAIFRALYVDYGDEYAMYSNAQSVIVQHVQEDFKLTDKVLARLPEEVKKAFASGSADKVDYQGKNYSMHWSLLGSGLYRFECKMRCLLDGDRILKTSAQQAFESAHQKNKDVENVAYSTDAVPLKLWRTLNEQVDALCAKQKVHYHPGSNNTLRDIVHPSLYPFIKGVSKATPSDALPFEPPEQKEQDFWGRPYENSIYQWLPANFDVSESGHVSISSYINNLDAQQYAPMYRTIEQVFECILPQMEAVCSNLRNDFYPLENKSEEGVAKSVPLRGRRLQVVCKIVQYEVTQEVNFDGVWHVEGMSHENILATGLCVFGRTPNFKGASIEFKRYLWNKEAEELIYSTPQNARRPTEQIDGGDVRPLGTVETPFGATIVFPNSHIHRVSKMSSSNGQVATRRILVFWLVNPQTPIVGSDQIAEQQKTISWAQAKQHQKALMRERSVYKASFEEREVFLCEH